MLLDSCNVATVLAVCFQRAKVWLVVHPVCGVDVVGKATIDAAQNGLHVGCMQGGQVLLYTRDIHYVLQTTCYKMQMVSQIHYPSFPSTFHSYIHHPSLSPCPAIDIPETDEREYRASIEDVFILRCAAFDEPDCVST